MLAKKKDVKALLRLWKCVDKTSAFQVNAFKNLAISFQEYEVAAEARYVERNLLTEQEKV